MGEIILPIPSPDIHFFNTTEYNPNFSHLVFLFDRQRFKVKFETHTNSNTNSLLVPFVTLIHCTSFYGFRF